MTIVCGVRLLVRFVLVAASGVALAQAAQVQTIRVISLPGRPLPVVVAQSQGIFAKYGIEVQVEAAQNSEILRANLANGTADIAHAAVDNAVAMAEMAGADVAIVIGGEGTLNELIVQPEIHSISDLRGRTVIVDAPNTAFALQLKKILLTSGLRVGRDYEMKPVGATPLRLQAMRDHKEYAASMLGPPTSFLAKRDGFVSLGSARHFLGSYQAAGGFVRRPWAHDHSELLVRYLAAYVEAQRWLLSPANKQQVIELLTKEFHIPDPVANQTYEVLVSSHQGLADDARLDSEGFQNVLRLRAEVEGQWDGRVPSPEKYYDPSYYNQALSKLKSAR